MTCVEVARLTGTSIVAGNQLRLLRDGGEYFPLLTQAIERAERSILLQMYRFQGGTIATRVAHALAERARAGVTVWVLIDDYGTGGMEPQLANLLCASGVALRVYNPFRMMNLWNVNRRNHRKLLAIDATVAFIGGMNLDDVFAGSDAKRPWRENAVSVHGPVARVIGESVVAAWAGGDQSEAPRPLMSQPVTLAGTSDAQLLLSSPERLTLRAAYLHVIGTARRSIFISSAYLVPQPVLAEALQDAAKRGIDVRVLTTGEHNNIALARMAGQATYGPLLRAGVRIFEYLPTMLHAKSIIVDGTWCALGSANLDACGFRFNLEAQLASCDEAFVKELEQSFLADAEEATEITWDVWKRQPVSRRVANVVLQPLRHIL